MSSFSQLWNLFGNIITEFWNLLGVFMEIFRMMLEIFFVIRMEDWWISYGIIMEVLFKLQEW